MQLTQRQETFCQEYIKTGNASEAYRAAYSSSNMKPETVWSKGCRLLKHDKVRARLEELRAPAVESARVTLEAHLNRLEELSRLAQEEGQVSAAVKAEELRGKACGIYVEKREVSQRINIEADFGMEE
jgi:phage terminase small subunit